MRENSALNCKTDAWLKIKSLLPVVAIYKIYLVDGQKLICSLCKQETGDVWRRLSWFTFGLECFAHDNKEVRVVDYFYKYLRKK